MEAEDKWWKAVLSSHCESPGNCTQVARPLCVSTSICWAITSAPCVYLAEIPACPQGCCVVKSESPASISQMLGATSHWNRLVCGWGSESAHCVVGKHTTEPQPQNMRMGGGHTTSTRNTRNSRCMRYTGFTGKLPRQCAFPTSFPRPWENWTLKIITVLAFQHSHRKKKKNL